VKKEGRGLGKRLEEIARTKNMRAYGGLALDQSREADHYLGSKYRDKTKKILLTSL
jgi:hypothetical protein